MRWLKFCYDLLMIVVEVVGTTDDNNTIICLVGGWGEKRSNMTDIGKFMKWCLGKSCLVFLSLASSHFSHCSWLEMLNVEQRMTNRNCNNISNNEVNWSQNILQLVKYVSKNTKESYFVIQTTLDHWISNKSGNNSHHWLSLNLAIHQERTEQKTWKSFS